MKTFWTGLGAVALSILFPALVLTVSRASKEKAARASIEEILIRCPVRVENALRESYAKEIHPWALRLTREIVEDRGEGRMDLALYQRLVLTALEDRAAAAGLGEAGLAMRLAASGEDTSITLRWREMEDKVDPEVEPLFIKPIIERTDKRGKVLSSGPANPPPSQIVISIVPETPTMTADAGPAARSEPRPQETTEEDDPPAKPAPASTASKPPAVAGAEATTRPPQPPTAPATRAPVVTASNEIFDIAPDQLALLTIQANPMPGEVLAPSAPDPETAATTARNFLNAGTRASRLALSRSPRVAREILEEFFWPEPDGPLAFTAIRAVPEEDEADLPVRHFLATMADGSERLLPVINTPNGGPKIDVPAFARHAPHPLEDLLANPTESGPCEFRVFVREADSAAHGQLYRDTGDTGDQVVVQLSNPDWSSGPLVARAPRQSEAGIAIEQLLAARNDTSPPSETSPSTDGIRAIVAISADEATRDTRQVHLEKVVGTGWIKP